jgi:peptidoglycan/LPS O-acetylase OafA/YrhL
MDGPTGSGVASAVPGAAGRIRFPALDGCRALAAFGVLITHVGLLSGFITRTPSVGPYLARMDVGVSIFFVLSGFLLYRPMVAARFAGESAGDTGSYARRRLLRIVPAYWVALTIVGFVLKAPGFEEPHSIVSHYLLLQVYDLTQLVGGPIQQSWSLATEVAFYVFVPCWAWLLARRPRSGRARSPERQLRLEVGALVALGAASVLANVALVVIGVADSRFAQLGTWLPFRIADFVPGMLLAVASAWISHRGLRLPRWMTHAPLAIGCWLGAVVVFWVVSTQLGLPMFPTFTPRQAFAVRILYVVFAALLVVPAVFARQDRGPVARVFANPVAIWLGLVSYGIYIWHEAWQDVYLRVTNQPVLNSSFLGMLVVTVVLTLASAAVSWYVVERPIMRWGARPRGGSLLPLDDSGPSVADPPSEAAPLRP